MEDGKAVENCAGTGQGLEISPLSRRVGNAFMPRGRPGERFSNPYWHLLPAKQNRAVIWLEGERQAGRFACWRFGQLAFHRGDSILTCSAGIGSAALIARSDFAN